MILSVREGDKEEAVEIGRRFQKIGYQIYATKGTAEALRTAGVEVTEVRKAEEETPNILNLIFGT